MRIISVSSTAPCAISQSTRCWPCRRVLCSGEVLNPLNSQGGLGVEDVIGAERASCSSEGRSGKEGRDWGWGEAEVGDCCRNMQGASVSCMRVKVHHGCPLPLTL